MAVIKGHGAPNRNTKGAIGDNYHDLSTGKSYVCTNAFKDSFGTTDYTWRFNDIVTKPTSEPRVEKIEEPKNDIPVVEETEPVPQVVQQERPRNNYNKPYNKQQYNKMNKN